MVLRHHPHDVRTRSLLKGHRKEQNVFRKMVRQKVRTLRKDRLKKREKKLTKGT